jgi:hypothetical protein
LNSNTFLTTALLIKKNRWLIVDSFIH